MYIILTISLLFQLLAIYAGMRLVRIFGLRSAWTLVVVAISLMVIRRVGLLLGLFGPMPDFISESIAMLTSIFLSIGMVYFWPSLTESEGSRKELEASEEKFKMLAEMSPDIIFINIGGKIVYVNKSAEDIMGYSRKEFCSPKFDFMKLIAPESSKRVRDGFLRHVGGEENTDSYQCSIVTKDGTKKEAIISTRLIPYENGKAILGSVTDITSREHIVAELRESNRRLDEMLKNVELIAISLNRMGEITFCNDFLLKLSGWTREEVTGKRWFDLFIPPESGVKEVFFATMDTGKMPPHFENEIILRDGSRRDIFWSNSVLHNTEGNIIGTMSIGEDVTERKKMERAKSDFVSLASHQLRTPLASIGWFSEMLLGKTYGDLDKKISEPIAEIYRSNRRMISLVNSLLNVARIESGALIINPRPTDILKIADGVVKELEPISKLKNISIKKRFRNPGEIMLDPALIGIILENLLSNAIKYAPDNGQVEVAISKGDTNLLISVKDNGIGVPKGQEDKIFEKLFRADNARSADPDGNGLGLYIVKSILDESGGQIWLETDDGAGTTFHVSIPLTGMKSKIGTKALVS